MARIPRIMIVGEPTAYHVISRTALDGFPIGDVEKEFFVGLIRKLGRLYFVEILGFCCMGNHFHLLVRMLPESDFSDEEIVERYSLYHGKDRSPTEGQIPFLRSKLSSLSEFMREVKLGFTRFFNKRHDRRGYFWGDRFKSVVVGNGDTLVNCLAYIDLNPVRAGIVKRPEEYRWSSMGYHAQTGNRDGMLSTDFGLETFGERDPEERFRRYRRYVYETGAVDQGEDRAGIDKALVAAERDNDFNLTRTRRFLYRTRYFTDGGIIGSKAFVKRTYRRVQARFGAKRQKVPQPISGLAGIYSLKRLTE